HGGHPVGTVFLGVAGPFGAEVTRLQLGGGRWDIRLGAVRAAARRLRLLVEQQ
ncbi:CinA family protein, partial [Mycolicibacterium vaccae]|nr:CinA family protein [Mycolicibacterium vaccae]